MRSIVSLITAAAVALHLVLGCCAHHSHAEGGCASHSHAPRTAIAQGHSHGCPHHHYHTVPVADSDETPADSEPSPGECNEGECAFLLAGKTTVLPDSGLIVPFLAPIDVTSATIELSRSRTCDDGGDPFYLAVRPHLLHQVFLN